MASRLRGMNVNLLREAALLPVLIVLIIVGTLVSPAFFTASNFAGIGEQSSALGVVVVGESLILLIGGMDLSLESTFGLAPMVAAWLILPVSAFGNGTQLNPYLGIVVLLAVGAVVGLVNGLLIVKGQAQRVHRDPRHDDRAGRPAERHRQGAVAVQPAAGVRLPGVGVRRPGAGLAHRHRGHLRR